MNHFKSRLLALCLIMTLSGVQARALPKIEQSDTLQLATEGAVPPFNFLQGTQLSGYEIEVTEKVFFILGKGKPERQAALSKAVDELRTDDTPVAMVKKRVGEDMASCR